MIIYYYCYIYESRIWFIKGFLDTFDERMVSNCQNENLEIKNVTTRKKKKRKVEKADKKKNFDEKCVAVQDKHNCLNDTSDTIISTQYKPQTKVNTTLNKKKQNKKQKSDEQREKAKVDKTSLDYMSQVNTAYILRNSFLSYSGLTAVMELKFEKKVVEELHKFVQQGFENGNQKEFLYEVTVRKSNEDENKSRTKKLNAPGFNTYQHCHVESWDNEKALNQRHNTAGLYGLPFSELVESNKTFKEICSFISVKLGVTPFRFTYFVKVHQEKKEQKKHYSNTIEIGRQARKHHSLQL